MYRSPPTRRVSALISAPQPPSYRGYLLIPGPGPAPLPPAGAPLLGLMSCPESAGAEMEAGAPAAGTPGPACPACPSPSMLASFPIASGAGLDTERRCRRCCYSCGGNSDGTQRCSSSAIITYNSASCTEQAR
ncbi:unnamed protein product [Pleuronectes platessa]|uniref:Uncharacterized protein n=1 Tax=Pleuronectes platessa TaxID=8262 RepID=A0A9N7TYG4_PLEPL|nr:unnamed protein product [Pleuronectes platessa]